jgi:hypothetical protein
MNAGRTCTQLTVRVIYPIGLKVLPELRSARLTIVAMRKPGLPEHTTITAPSY